MDGKKNRMPGLMRALCAACRTARWAGRFSLPLEIEGGVEIAQSGETVLFCRDSLADLPPVQLEAHPGLLLAEGRADLRGCQVELSAPRGLGRGHGGGVPGRVERRGRPLRILRGHFPGPGGTGTLDIPLCGGGHAGIPLPLYGPIWPPV